jgi:hypothetical protein
MLQGKCEKFSFTEGHKGQNVLESRIPDGDNSSMRVTADERKRVVLPSAAPGDSFEVQTPNDGTFILTRLEPATLRPAEVKLEKRGAFTVGVLNRPIDEQALREALAEFP